MLNEKKLIIENEVNREQSRYEYWKFKRITFNLNSSA